MAVSPRHLFSWPRSARRYGWVGGVALLLLLVGLYWEAATLEGAFHFGDIFRLHYPAQQALRRALSQGALPLWTGSAFGGYPLLAEGQFGPLYPPNWLLLPFPLAAAINLFALGHLLWAGGGMALLGRRLGLAPWAALLGGLAYMLSGFMTAHLNHLNMVAVAAWLPWLVLCLRGLMGRGRGERPVKAGLGAALCVAMMALAGHPQMLLLSLLVALADVAWQAVGGERADPGQWGGMGWRPAALALAALALGLSLAGAQLLPSAELAGLSERAGGLDPEFFGSFSLHPAYLALLASPFLLGDPYPGLSVELLGYVGLLPLLLALWALAQRRRRVALWGVMALLSLLLALGRWNPLYILLLRLPVFNWFRVPARFLYPFTFAMAILAAHGADALSPAGRARWPREGVALLLASLVAALAIRGGAALPLEALLGMWRFLPLALLVAGGGLILAARRGHGALWVAGACWWLLAVDLGAVGLVFARSYNATIPLEALAAEPRSLAFLAQDPGLYRIMTHEAITPVMPVMRESFYPNLALAHDVESINGYYPLTPARWAHLWERLDPRLLNMLNVKYFMIPQVLPVDEASEFYDLENPFSPSLVGARVPVSELSVASVVVESYVSHSVDWPDGTPAATIILEGEGGEAARLELRIGMETAEWAYGRSDVQENVRHSRPAIGRVFAARSGFPPEDHPGYVYRAEYVLTPALPVTTVEMVAHLPQAFVRVERLALWGADGQEHLLSHLAGFGDHTLVYRSEDVVIYENHDVGPRAALVHRAQVAEGGDAALGQATQPGFDPRSQVVLESGQPLDNQPGEGEYARVVAHGDRRVEVQVRAATAAYLVLADAHYPGWKARLNGQEVPVHLANGYLRAVAIPAGEHQVAFYYDPASWKLGLAVSGLSALVLGVLAAAASARRRV